MAAAEAAIANPLLDETSMKGAQGLLISITGGRDMTLFEVDEAATRIREEVDAGCQHHSRRDLRRGALEGMIRTVSRRAPPDGSAAPARQRSDPPRG
jgi:cell division protein FtsZ